MYPGTYQMKWLFCACLQLAVLPLSHSGQEILFYTSPGDRGYNAGVYGDDTRHILNGTVARPRPIGYHCLNYDQVIDSITVKHMSYDHRMQSVLMQLDVGGDDAFTLVRAPVCITNQKGCRAYQNDPMEVLFHKKRFGLQKVGPVLMYDNEIYMVVTLQTRGTGTRYNTIELRKLRPCKSRFPIRRTDVFDFEDCTKLLATVVKEAYTDYPTTTVASHILAVQDGAYPSLFLQIRNLTYSTNTAGTQRVHRYTMQLLRVSEQDGIVGLIHSEDVDPRYQKYDIDHLGGISLRSNKLCWTAVDRILCADWTGGRVVDKRVVMRSGLAQKACLGIAASDMMVNVTTGLAIKSSSRDLEIYFGCVAQDNSRGGAGYMRLRQGRVEPEIYPLRNRTMRLPAGSMFLTDICGKPQVAGVRGSSPAWRAHLEVTVFVSFLLSLWVVLK